jgi:hypothetical protein
MIDARSNQQALPDPGQDFHFAFPAHSQYTSNHLGWGAVDEETKL